MKQFFVILQVEETVEVTAETPEEAAELAEAYQGAVRDSAITGVLGVVEA